MGRPGFRRVLLAVADSYRNKRAELERAANSLADAVSQAEVFTGARADFDFGVVGAQIKSMTQLFDIKNGGFGRAPKFPHSSAIDLILERYQQTKEKHLLAMAETTLEKMARGGVYDQLAGGFHRYSVDERWLVPHFEKMSYDNSELLKNYVHASQVSPLAHTEKPNGQSLFIAVAENIVSWVNKVLSDQEAGGFYASQDADYSLDDDGDYFTWTVEEVRAVLTPEESRVIELYYDVEPHGEMHHNPAKNVLWEARTFEEVAKTVGRDMKEVARTWLDAVEKMREARSARPTPFIDRTMYVSWNAMFVSAYLDAARVIGGSEAEGCRAFAVKTLDRMLKEVWTESRGFGHRIGGPALEGSLDDQVFGVLALLDAYETMLDPRYFSAAQRTIDLAIAPQYGLFAATYGLAATLFAHHPIQVVITGLANDPAAQALEAAAHRVFRFDKSVLRVTPQTPQLHLAGALKETLPHLPIGKALAVVCSGQTCFPPTSDPAQLIALLENGIVRAATS